jgi:steroid 5-alpha reductase family enzyme
MLIAEFTGVWAWQLKSKNAGMIDPIWAMSPEAVAVLEPAWIGSIAGEAIADLQLRRSKADNSHRERFAARIYGAILDILIIFSSACIGLLLFRLPSAPGHGLSRCSCHPC